MSPPPIRHSRPASCTRTVSPLRRDRPAEKRGKAIDGRSGLVDGLRLGESSRSGLGGEVGLGESQALFGKVFGQQGEADASLELPLDPQGAGSKVSTLKGKARGQARALELRHV